MAAQRARKIWRQSPKWRKFRLNRKHATCIVTASKLCTFDLLGPVQWVSLLVEPLDNRMVQQLILLLHKKLHVANGGKFSNIFFIYYFHWSHLLRHLSPSLHIHFFRCNFFLVSWLREYSGRRQTRERQWNDIKIHVKLWNHQRENHNVFLIRNEEKQKTKQQSI